MTSQSTGTDSMDVDKSNQANCFTIDPKSDLFKQEGEKEFDGTDRDAALEWVFVLTIFIAKKMGISLGGPNFDLDESNMLAGALATVYAYLRKKRNRDHSVGLKYAGFKIKGLKDATFITSELVPNGIGNFEPAVVTPIVNMLTSFKMQYDEVRTGVTKFEIQDKSRKRSHGSGKDDNKKSMTSYGLTPHHIPLLEGITFPPERRTGLLRGMGPLALAIIAINEDKFKEKPANALRESIQMLPMADAICSLLETNLKDGYQHMLRALGDVLILTGARTTHRIAMPLTFAAALYDIMKKDQLMYWSFSGPRMQYFVNALFKISTFTIRTKATTDHIQQAVFHAIFGTAFEDLGLLSSVTNKVVWAYRSDIGESLQRKGVSEKVAFPPIQLVLLSKMSRALQSKAIGSAAPCATTRCSWSGRRERTLAESVSEYLRDNTTASQYQQNAGSIAAALMKLKNELMEPQHREKLVKLGTTEWYDAITGKISAAQLRETGNSFYGIRQ